jgi:hypothetical protein
MLQGVSIVRGRGLTMIGSVRISSNAETSMVKSKCPKLILHPFLGAPRAAGARNICIGFADVTRIRRESGARKCYAHNLRTMCAGVHRQIMHNVARAYKGWMLLLDSSVHFFASNCFRIFHKVGVTFLRPHHFLIYTSLRGHLQL